MMKQRNDRPVKMKNRRARCDGVFPLNGDVSLQPSEKRRLVHRCRHFHRQSSLAPVSLGSAPPLAQTILGPSPERKGWFVADCSTVTHILTRTFWHDASHRDTVVHYFCLLLTYRNKRIRCNPIPWIKLASSSNNKVHSLFFSLLFCFAKMGKFG